jgi:hypothetical protein
MDNMRNTRNTRNDSFESDNNKRNSEKVVHQCKGCVCDQLRRLPTQTEVDLFLSGGQVIEDVIFITLDQENCCAFFTDPTTEPGSTLIIDCQEIIAIRIEAD